ncbi:hypothetical protein VHEMI04282 [[Torrubiella] hemipterigena]|uniref:HD domain-containing protein n=1 Tax=[Torrubiella] hemipterigena TaxID=1531966 RepID=A0A0A1TDD2_9HYPO|nr:hypothetical protein VHEMI04282 [[Torrubiella] hemipterigena]
MTSKSDASNLPEGIRNQFPNGDLPTSILELTRNSVSEPIFNHSLRVYLFAKWLSEKEDQGLDDHALSLLFAACVFHDLGTCDAFNGPQRFEVEGADVAKSHLLARQIAESDAHKVWTAIALHTSPGIAERIDPFTRLVRLAVLIDFSPATRSSLGAVEYGREVEALLPRLDIEENLAKSVVCQAKGEQVVPDKTTYPSTQKHPAGSWPGMLLRAHLENPGHQGRNPAF